ncbi:Protein YIPF [Entamoeba marina]
MSFADDSDFVTFDVGSFDNLDDFNFNDQFVQEEHHVTKPPPKSSPIPPPVMFSASPPPTLQEPDSIESISHDKIQDVEPPLLEELGIDFKLILKRIIMRLNPMSSIDSCESDVIGSLFFGLLLGFGILLNGKFRFGYVFGFTFVGSLAEYFVLNLIANKDIAYFLVLTNLGYSSYPLVLLTFSSLFLPAYIQLYIAIFAIVWSTFASSRLFTIIQEIKTYPLALYFILFVLLVMF